MNNCNYSSLLISIQERMNCFDEMNDILFPCPHSAAKELLLLLQLDEESLSNAETYISDLCKEVSRNKKKQNI